jgi:3-oxoacyl-[acyl-carrier protein] reductase
MTKRFEAKVALITGASKGIGAGIARRLASEGAAVAVNYSASKDAADKVVADIIAQGGKAVAVHGNLVNAQDIQSVVADTVAAFGPIDVLVNNAGIYEFAPLDGVTPEHFHRHFDLNVLGLLLVSQEAVRHFSSAGGCIVNISSGVSTLTPPNASVYSATKAAVDAITSSLAKELAPRKIRVNAVNPWLIATEGVIAAGLHQSDMRKWIESVTPSARIGTVDEVAAAVAFFASQEALYVTGETLHVTGGLK